MWSVRAKQGCILILIINNVFVLLSLAILASRGCISDFLILLCNLLFNLVLHLDRRSYLTQALHQLIIVCLFNR